MAIRSQTCFGNNANAVAHPTGHAATGLGAEPILHYIRIYCYGAELHPNCCY